MAKVLIVEDEPAIAELIQMHLQLAGHVCLLMADGALVLDAVRREAPDIVLLDVMLPGLDGFSVMEALAPSAVPVIFLTARDALADKVRGLRLGADDYIVKPFEALELLSRVEAVLRRTLPKAGDTVKIDHLDIHLAEHVVKMDGKPVELTAKEFGLLEIFVRNSNIALSRERLLELVWGYAYAGETRTVDVHVQRLRQKLRLDSRLKTIYKVGYRLEVAR